MASPSTRTRWIPVLALAPPEQLAGVRDHPPARYHGPSALLAGAATEELSRDPSARTLAPALRRVMEALGTPLEWQEEPSASDAHAAWQRNDLYFGVERDAVNPPQVLLLHGLARTALSI